MSKESQQFVAQKWLAKYCELNSIFPKEGFRYGGFATFHRNNSLIKINKTTARNDEDENISMNIREMPTR